MALAHSSNLGAIEGIEVTKVYELSKPGGGSIHGEHLPMVFQGGSAPHLISHGDLPVNHMAEPSWRRLGDGPQEATHGTQEPGALVHDRTKLLARTKPTSYGSLWDS